MGGHTGWVRSLATSGKYLFSCGCNHLRQWDTTYSVPKEVSDTQLVRGDILGIAAGGKRVFTAGADGSIRCAGGCAAVGGVLFAGAVEGVSLRGRRGGTWGSRGVCRS